MKKVVSRKLTRIRPISSLVPTLIKICKIAFNNSLVSLPLETLKNILGFQSLRVEEKNRVSLTWRSECEKTPRVKENLLSLSRREVLIKSVIQIIPTYSMSWFKLPKGLIKELEIVIRKFWWGYSNELRGSRRLRYLMILC